MTRTNKRIKQGNTRKIKNNIYDGEKQFFKNGKGLYLQCLMPLT